MNKNCLQWLPRYRKLPEQLESTYSAVLALHVPQRRRRKQMLASIIPKEDHFYETLRLSGADNDSYVRDCRATGHREKASILGTLF